MTKMIKIAAAVLATVLLSACASSVAYRADYVPDRAVATNEQISGRVLVYTTSADDARVDTSGSTTFTGSAAELTTPIGMITREIAVKVFSQLATDGAVAGNDLSDAGRYSVIVRPESIAFKHGFEQLKNLGLAITPDVQCQLRISILDPSGRSLFERDYDSGVIEGKSYVLSGSPKERINRLAHETIYDLMRRAADDVRLNAPVPQRQAAVH
jgi:hypothetical protein